MHRVEETPKKLKLDQELLSYQLAIRAKGGVRNTKLGARNTRCERIRKVQIHRSVKKKKIGCQKLWQSINIRQECQ